MKESRALTRARTFVGFLETWRYGVLLLVAVLTFGSLFLMRDLRFDNSDESFFTVDIQFFVRFHYFGSFDGVEVPEFRAAREVLAVFVFQHLIPVDGIIYDVSQMVINLGNFLFHLGDQFIRLV